MALVFVALAVFLLAGCSHAAPPTTTTGPASTTPASGGGQKVALGTNNPAQGDCTTDLKETASAVGSVELTLTPTTFTAKIHLRAGTPNASYGVFMQQVPGSCPQSAANGGTLTTNAAGRGHATASVPRVSGATTFFVQLVPAGSEPGQYTSDRISREP